MLVAGAPAPAPDVSVASDAKVAGTSRHTDSSAAGAGVVVGDSATATLQQVQELLAKHRVWDRFPI